uniref:Cytochrome c domain-containing protein n=1 Tax=uncultured Armatimonadetes bacterium TaxID=157466 RepID=A0A6J4GZV9_9BACT|nr:hypothetical protein AVDCRST_MAG63-1520 [uncultured Armatimonadetes bacterium]
MLAYLAMPLLLLGAGIARGGEQPKAAPAKTVAPKKAASDQATYEQHIRPVLDQFCTGCHGDAKASGGVNLSSFKTVTAVQRDQATWRKVLAAVREGSMPPSNMPQPSPDQRDRLSQWLAHTLNNVDESLLPKNPGRVLIHRLSRAEYNNTVRDLFGVTSKPADKFPADGGGGGGFDNNADTLFVPPILMERYLGAAGEILDETKPARLFFVRPSKTLAPRAAARKIVGHYAMRAFRRPVETPEVDRLMRLYDGSARRGASFEDSVKLALKAVLISPNFLFRVERDRPGTRAYPISDWELASRLSYFLWASMPDDTLFKLAAQKRLRDPKVLEQQVQRMLKSPKSAALADSFAGQWLRVRDLYTVSNPDPRRFPGFTPALRDAMYGETIAFVDDVLREDRNLLHLLDAGYTYLNEDLAKHYNIPNVTGPKLRRVRLSDGRRGGVLTMASVLTLTSYPQRTSPVLRGKWVLEEILGTPAPPPPAVVAVLGQEDAPKEGLTFRQRLEKHREKPECVSCHVRMDPLGFGLENFDGIGRWRDEIGGAPVDAAGTLANGEKFVGPSELKKHLLTRKEDFVRNLAEKMLSYSLGRGLEPYDLPAVRRITTRLEKDGYRSSTLILEIVKSYPFQYRKSS